MLLHSGSHLPSLLTSQACREILPKEANGQEAEDFQDLSPKHPVPGHCQGDQGALQVGTRFVGRVACSVREPARFEYRSLLLECKY